MPLDEQTKEALKVFTKRPPQENVKQAILMTMKGQDHDRAAALTTATLTESTLALAIAYIGDFTQNQIAKEIWSTRGTFHSFYKKIIESKKRGAIGERASANLHTIRSIRNVFAHGLSNIEFNEPTMKRACNCLSLGKNEQFFVDQEVERKARYQFGYACHHRPLRDPVEPGRPLARAGGPSSLLEPGRGMTVPPVPVAAVAGQRRAGPRAFSG